MMVVKNNYQFQGWLYVINNDDIEEEIINDEPCYHEKEVSDKDLFIFAELILLGIGILFFVGIMVEVFIHDSNVFKACNTILPPIATLVIGYYFAKTN